MENEGFGVNYYDQPNLPSGPISSGPSVVLLDKGIRGTVPLAAPDSSFTEQAVGAKVILRSPLEVAADSFL